MSGGRAQWRRYRWERPDWWLVPVAVVAWAGLATVAVAAPAPAHHEAHGSFALGLAWWCVMTAAMMLPVARPDARWLAHRSLASRRGRTVALHAAGFLGVWIVAGAGLVLVMSALHAGSAAAAGALVAAAAWHVTPARRRVLRRCSAGLAPAIRGFQATADCLRAGTRTGSKCLVTCGPAMVAMAAAHSLPLMVAVWVVGASERRAAPNVGRRAGRPLEAFGLAAIAFAVAAGAAGAG